MLILIEYVAPPVAVMEPIVGQSIGIDVSEAACVWHNR